MWLKFDKIIFPFKAQGLVPRLIRRDIPKPFDRVFQDCRIAQRDRNPFIPSGYFFSTDIVHKDGM